MNSFLLLALTAGLLSPIATKADDFKVRDTCGRFHAGFITATEAHKKLGLPNTIKMRWTDEIKRFNDLNEIAQQTTLDEYCDTYTGASEVYYD